MPRLKGQRLTRPTGKAAVVCREFDLALRDGSAPTIAEIARRAECAAQRAAEVLKRWRGSKSAERLREVWNMRSCVVFVCADESAIAEFYGNGSALDGAKEVVRDWLKEAKGLLDKAGVESRFFQVWTGSEVRMPDGRLIRLMRPARGDSGEREQAVHDAELAIDAVLMHRSVADSLCKRALRELRESFSFPTPGNSA